MEDVRFRCFLSNSKRSLLEVTKAISNPEKNAEKINVSKMSIKLSKIIFALKFSYRLSAKIQFFT